MPDFFYPLQSLITFLFVISIVITLLFLIYYLTKKELRYLKLSVLIIFVSFFLLAAGLVIQQYINLNDYEISIVPFISNVDKDTIYKGIDSLRNELIIKTIFLILPVCKAFAA
jgi:phosphoglycerol transferase MdoB-like AlkP superfamily enzyme